MLVRTPAEEGGNRYVSIACMAPSRTNDCPTPSWHAADEWPNVLGSEMTPCIIQCLTQVREGPRRGLQLSDPPFQDVPHMFDGVEVWTICWPLHRRNLHRPKVVRHALCLVWSGIIVHKDEGVSDVGGIWHDIWFEDVCDVPDGRERAPIEDVQLRRPR